MPNSLRVRLKNLWRNGILSDKDFERLCKGLDNENVLDKIKAEIEKSKKFAIDCDGESDLGIALEIIDKYKTESEVLNGRR